VSIDSAFSDAITVPNISQNLEQLIKVFRGRWYYLVSAPSVKDAAAIGGGLQASSQPTPSGHTREF
jgi:hypothetical protein